MKLLKRKIKIAFAIVTLLILLCVVWFYSFKFVIFYLSPNDAISQKLFQKTQNTDPMVEWLTAYHGEGPSTAMFETFAEWGIENKKDFEKIIINIPAKDQSRFFKLLTYTINDSGLKKKYLQHFITSSNSTINKFQTTLKPK